MELEVINNVIEAKIDEKVFQSILNQLDKDFMMTGITFDFNDLTPPQLLQSLYEIVEELLSKEYATLLNLFYRMDIPESAIQLEIDSELTVEEKIVSLMLRREYFKIKMREKYSKLIQ